MEMEITKAIDAEKVSRTQASGWCDDQSDTKLQATPLIPLSVKLGFTAFMIVLVPYYWHEYGPTNFLYFCDVALFLALAAVWTERPLPASMAAVGITVPQFIWQVDFVGQLIDFPTSGMTNYMFDSQISLFARSLSFFHFWLPILLGYLVWKLGYDRRALPAWTVVAWTVILIAYFQLPAPGDKLDFVNQPCNVNYVYGLDSKTPQQWVSASAWLAIMMGGLPVAIYYPTHLLLGKLHRVAGHPKPTIGT